MNLEKFPRYPLTFGPSPITPMKRLSEYLGGDVEIYAKREDCNSGLAFGGNKTRKLEYLIPEALAQGCDTLVSIGGVQSNQTRQVAAVAAHLGMKCILVQENWVNYADAVYDRVGNIELSRIMGADVRLDPAGFDIGIRESWQQAMDEAAQNGGKPFPIPAGCSEHPYGGLGFVGFAEEVRQQEKNWALNLTISWCARSPAVLRPGWWWALPLMVAPVTLSVLMRLPNQKNQSANPAYRAKHRRAGGVGPRDHRRRRGAGYPLRRPGIRPAE